MFSTRVRPDMSRSEQPPAVPRDADAATEDGWAIDREEHVSEWAALFRTEPRDR